MPTVTVPLGPASVDISGVRAGDQNLITVAITSGGQPLDLTGLEVRAQARRVATDAEALTASVEVTDAVAGTVLVAWPGDDVRDFLGTSTRVNGVWDLQISEPDGAGAVTLAAGRFAAELDVTR